MLSNLSDQADKQLVDFRRFRNEKISGVDFFDNC